MTSLRFLLFESGHARRCLLLVLFFAFAPCPLYAQGADVCVPSPAVQAALDTLPSQTAADTDWEFHQKYVGAIQALRQKYPGDVFVERRYVSSRSNESETVRIIEEYKAKLARDPGNSRLLYLYGLTLLGRQSPDAIKLFTTALEKRPEFPWPHLQLVMVYSTPVFLDKAKSLDHLKAFLQACPASFDGYSWLTRSDNVDVIRESAAKLRSLLATRSDLAAIGAYQTLWALEFKVRAAAEYDALRKQVADDLKRLRALNLEDKRVWYLTLEEGYKLANDQKQADWAKEQRQLRLPYYWELAAMSKWSEEHKYPSEDAPADKKRAYYGERLKQLPGWIKEHPNDTSLLWSRVTAMVQLDDVPSVEIEAAVEQAFKVAQKNAGPPGVSSYEYFRVAENLSKKHLQPARVVEMAEKGLAQLDIEEKSPDYDLYATKEDQEASKFYRVGQRIDPLGFLVDGQLQLKQDEKAQAVLAQIDQRLQDLKTLAGDKQDRRKTYSTRSAAYWGRMGRLAELQGRKVDAMAYYQNALLTRLDAEQKPEPGVNDELADDAQRLWASLGGTTEGWKTWYGRRADALANVAPLSWEEAKDAFPSFEFADLNGKTWTQESLKGKTTFLNFWASW